MQDQIILAQHRLTNAFNAFALTVEVSHQIYRETSGVDTDTVLEYTMAARSGKQTDIPVYSVNEEDAECLRHKPTDDQVKQVLLELNDRIERLNNKTVQPAAKKKRLTAKGK